MVVTIGERIRSERLRLGLSQEQFASLAGAKKGAQLKWEKGQSLPTADILAAWARAGARIDYILNGGSDAGLVLDRLEEVLSAPQVEAARVSLSVDEVLARAKSVLHQIATSEQPGVDERAKRRADDVLVHFFEDDEANNRVIARGRAMLDGRKQAKRELVNAMASVGLTVGQDLQSILLTLLIDYRISATDMMLLFEAIHVEIERRASKSR